MRRQRSALVELVLGASLVTFVAAQPTRRANTTLGFDAAFHECFYTPRAPTPTGTSKPVEKPMPIKDGDLFFDPEQFPASRTEACKAVLEADKTGCALAYLRAVPSPFVSSTDIAELTPPALPGPTATHGMGV